MSGLASERAKGAAATAAQELRKKRRLIRCMTVLQDSACDTGDMQAASKAITRPAATEYAPYFEKYVSLVSAPDVLAALEDQPRETLGILSTLSEEQAASSYAPGKWTIKEMLGHIIDTERIFSYRALRFGRNDITALASFEQDGYVLASGSNGRSLADLIDEFVCVRRATVWLFRSLDSDAWTRQGTASGNPLSVRAIAYIIAGHELHHRRVLQDKYLS